MQNSNSIAMSGVNQRNEALRHATRKDTDPLPSRDRGKVTQKLLPIFLVLVVGSLLAFSLIIGKLASAQGAAPVGFMSLALIGAGLAAFVAQRSKGPDQAAQGQGTGIWHGGWPALHDAQWHRLHGDPEGWRGFHLDDLSLPVAHHLCHGADHPV